MTATASGTAGNITVTPSTACGNGPAQTLAVNPQSFPAQPSAITGTSTPCAGQTGVIYSVTNIVGMTYTWTVPGDWTITAGQGTNSLTVTIGNNSGNVTVTPSNGCGSGTPQTLAVTTQSAPAQPVPSSGNTNPCYATVAT
jgi:hypothetical protein